MDNQKLLENQHKKYTLKNNFVETMSLFGNICYNKLCEFYFPLRRLTILSFIVLYIDFFAPYFQFITRRIFDYCIWFLLGVLSSIGFGTGMQTGVLFVFPEIIAEYKRNIESYSDIYTNIYYSFIFCLPMVLIWGVGTAFGELPPYFIARKMNYKDSKGLDKMYKLLGDNSDSLKNSVNNTVEKFRKNKNYSFVTILCLSAWPNAMFDICGISAGLVKLRIDEFLIPTIIGKAFIKTPIQLAFILYSYAHYGEAITQNNEISYLYYLWNTFVISFTLYIFKEYIEGVVN
jgi:vacuole membrane protein 1